MTTPTEELVRAACEEFDRDDPAIEQALTELFDQYPDNSDLRHVLLKVVALNSLYSTQISVYSETIPNVMDVSRHIYQNYHEIDLALAAGSPEIVDWIASVKVSGKKDRYYFSFATKYCGWHKPELYPIWDSRVDRYVGCLKGQPRFAEFFNTGKDHWSYPQFRKLMTIFRDCYGLGSCTFKDIDKFLWIYGGK